MDGNDLVVRHLEDQLQSELSPHGWNIYRQLRDLAADRRHDEVMLLVDALAAHFGAAADAVRAVWSHVATRPLVMLAGCCEREERYGDRRN